MVDARTEHTGRSRTQGRVRRGVAAVVMAGSIAVAMVGAGAGAATAASKSSGSALATLKIQAAGVQVKTKGGAAFIAAKEGQALKQGDALKTDTTGKAEIAYTDGSLTRLGTSTEFSITKLTNEKGARQTQGSLSVGSTWNRAAKVSESGEFSIKAGGATAAVEGTAFVVTCPSTTVVCTVTAIVDTVSVDSDDWTVTSAVDAH